MRNRPPDVTDAAVADCIRDGWGLRVTGLSYAPVGFGSHHWYAETGRGRRFVTVDTTRDAQSLRAALGAARAAREAGLEFVAAPIPGTDGALLRPVGRNAQLSVNDWIDGTTVASAARPGGGDPESTATDGFAGRIVAMLARLHAVHPAQTPAHRADLLVQGRPGYAAALRRIDRSWPGPYGERVRAVLADHRELLSEAFVIHDRQRAGLLAGSADWVITHGEPHAHNVMVTADGLRLIDWDTALIAPAARDLWQVGGAAAEVIASYEAATGRVVARDDLRYFRRDWDLAEVCQYVSDFAVPHDDTEDSQIKWGGLLESLDRLTTATTRRDA